MTKVSKQEDFDFTFPFPVELLYVITYVKEKERKTNLLKCYVKYMNSYFEYTYLNKYVNKYNNMDVLSAATKKEWVFYFDLLQYWQWANGGALVMFFWPLGKTTWRTTRETLSYYIFVNICINACINLLIVCVRKCIQHICVCSCLCVFCLCLFNSGKVTVQNTTSNEDSGNKKKKLLALYGCLVKRENVAFLFGMKTRSVFFMTYDLVG